MHEFYCDVIKDWRGWFASLDGSAFSGQWDPSTEPPTSERNYWEKQGDEVTGVLNLFIEGNAQPTFLKIRSFSSAWISVSRKNSPGTWRAGRAGKDLMSVYACGD